MVEPGSTIRTDEWSGYPSIAKHGYLHIAVKGHASVPGEDPTPLVHRIASLLKRWLLGTHQGGVRHEHSASYLEEFVFRFNRRTSRSRGKLGSYAKTLVFSSLRPPHLINNRQKA